jgi:hypothetical protein
MLPPFGCVAGMSPVVTGVTLCHFILASIIYIQTCRTYRSTVFLPFVDQQLSGDAKCNPVDTGTEGWLLYVRPGFRLNWQLLALWLRLL